MNESEPQIQSRCCDEYDEYRRRQWAFRHSRRTFLQATVGLLATGAAMPHLLLQSALADGLSQGSTAPTLVIIQLAGGNDGLNTIVPYGADLYYRARPVIGVPARSVIPIDKIIGFNPNLKPLSSLFTHGKLAIIQGVGYPNPDRSHFRSTQIWETGDPVGQTTTGWLGRYLDTTPSTSSNPLRAIALGPMVPMTLVTNRTPVPSIENINSFRF